MEKLERHGLDIFVSRDIWEEYISDSRNDADDYGIKEDLRGLVSPEQRHYIELFSQLRGLDKLACLDAHGFSQGKDWFFLDEGKEKNVQNWVNNASGKYSTIVLLVCNTGRPKPHVLK